MAADHVNETQELCVTLSSKQNLVFSRYCFVEYSKKSALKCVPHVQHEFFPFLTNNILAWLRCRCLMLARYPQTSEPARRVQKCIMINIASQEFGIQFQFSRSESSDSLFSGR